MKYITVNFVLLLLFFISFSLGDELGFPESIGNAEGSKKRSLDLRTGGNTIGVLSAVKMPVMPVQSLHQVRPQQSMNPSYRTQMVPRVEMPPPPQGFKKRQLMMTEASSLPLGVPPFKSIPKNTLLQVQHVSPGRPNLHDNRQLTGADRYLKKMASLGMQAGGERISPVYAEAVPDFQALPSSIITATLVQPTKVEYYPNDDLPEIDLKGHTVEELAAAANVSVDVIKAAIKMRQNQLMNEKKNAASLSKQKVKKTTIVETTQSTTSLEQTEKVTTQSTATTTTKPRTTSCVSKKKVTKKPLKNGHKVMNAPKEYYPIGYEKNFDDDFKSRIDLPATSFHCGDQKHFPGLYADQDLGCMVFHVCALTDDGLIMKSFLCPESTLFDQTILKCNWWFYTDCKSSKSLYDSNLPVSKSYQLMKSLAYFNKNYQKAGNSSSLDIPSIKSENASLQVSIVSANDQQ